MAGQVQRHGEDTVRTRILVAATVAAMLGVLVTWQWHRERLVNECQSSGGVWNGSTSRCDQPRRPILQRDLRRT